MCPSTDPDGRRRSLSADLVERLTDSIRQGFVRPGERLPTESVLVETHGVSRTVVREAMSRLQAAGLVETHRGRGSFVLAVPASGPFDAPAGAVHTLDDALDLVEFRMAVEVEAASLAAARRSERDLAAIAAAQDELRSSNERPDRAVQADLAFHVAIATASRNHYFGQLLRSFGPGLMVLPAERIAEQPAVGRHLDVVCGEHDEILAAIARGEPEAARAAIRLHLSNTRARLRWPGERTTGDDAPTGP